MSGVVFLTSERNVLKRDSSSGNTRLAPPATLAYGGLYVTNYTVAHSLGYAPVFRYYLEPFGDGIIWPPLADRVTGYSTNPLNLSDTGPAITAWADETNLYLQLFYYDPSLTATYPVYWVIYKDYPLI